VLNDRDYRIFLGTEHRRSAPSVPRLEVGYVFGRKLQLDRAGTQVDPKSALMLRRADVIERGGWVASFTYLAFCAERGKSRTSPFSGQPSRSGTRCLTIGVQTKWPTIAGRPWPSIKVSGHVGA